MPTTTVLFTSPLMGATICVYCRFTPPVPGRRVSGAHRQSRRVRGHGLTTPAADPFRLIVGSLRILPVGFGPASQLVEQPPHCHVQLLPKPCWLLRLPAPDRTLARPLPVCPTAPCSGECHLAPSHHWLQRLLIAHARRRRDFRR